MSSIMLLAAETGIPADALVKAGGLAGALAVVGLLLVLPLFLEQRREIRRLAHWQGRKPERGEQEGDIYLPPPRFAATSTAAPMSPAARVTADRPALQRITVDRPAIPEPSRRRRLFENLRCHRLLYSGLALLLAVAIAAAVIVIPTLTDGDGGNGRPALDRAAVDLVVLNGSSKSALAKGVANSLAASGFASVRTAKTGTSLATVVRYAPGSRRAGLQVGRRLEVDDVQELDPQTQDAAPGADVVVVVGEDSARG